eukprot:UN34796
MELATEINVPYDGTLQLTSQNGDVLYPHYCFWDTKTQTLKFNRNEKGRGDIVYVEKPALPLCKRESCVSGLKYKHDGYWGGVYDVDLSKTLMGCKNKCSENFNSCVRLAFKYTN